MNSRSAVLARVHTRRRCLTRESSISRTFGARINDRAPNVFCRVTRAARGKLPIFRPRRKLRVAEVTVLALWEVGSLEDHLSHAEARRTRRLFDDVA